MRTVPAGVEISTVDSWARRRAQVSSCHGVTTPRMVSRCKASSRSISSAWRPRTSQRAAASMFVPVYFRWLELRADFLVAAPKRASAERGSVSPYGSAGLKTERAAIRRLLCKKVLMPPVVTAIGGVSVSKKGVSASGRSSNAARGDRKFSRSSRIQSVKDLTDAQLLERFLVRREEVAFALLVQRHGPMVLSVSRRVLNHEHDAEDVFQAT